jgi:DNA-binding IclR family transcriptional regulator
MATGAKSGDGETSRGGRRPGRPSTRPPEERAGQRVESVERALSLLEAFADGAPRLSLGALAQRTGQYRSTILRLAASLERFGHLHRDADGHFRLGPSLLRLGALYQAGFDAADHVRPALARLVEATGETASFYVREGAKRICLHRRNGPRMVRSHLDEGAELPLDRGAAGHVLTAWTETGGMRHAEIRTAGFAISKGERDPDSTAVAVPVFGPRGALFGALGIVGPEARMTQEALTAALGALRAEAEALSARLGAPPPR